MEERRRAPRMREENEVTIIVLSNREKNLPKEKIIGNYTKDISVFGVKIQTDILLPVDTLIELDFTSEGVQQQIKVFGKVKWANVIIEDEFYESGVEFFSKPSYAIRKLGDFILWKLKSESELIKKELSLIDSDEINIVDTKEQPPIVSGDINIVETKEQPPIVSGDINIVETKEQPPIVSGEMNILETKEQPPIVSGDINIVETKEQPPIVSDEINIVETKKQPPIKSIVETKERPPIKNQQWTKITIISLGTIILIVFLLRILGSLPEFDSELVPDIIIGIVYILYIIAIIMVVYGFYQLIKFALTLNKEGFTWWGILWGGEFLIVFALSIMVIIKFYLAFIYPQTNEKVTKKFDSLTTKSATLPAPPIAAPAPKASLAPATKVTPPPATKVTPPPAPKVTPPPAPKATPAPAPKATPPPAPKATPPPAPKATPPPAPKASPAPAPKASLTPAPKVTPTPAPKASLAPAPKATQKIKIIGNSDSKRYHLPGMKYYNAVKAYHRVEFDSEADAIKAGYNKAPQ